MFDLFTDSTAIFSTDRRHRYALWRRWDVEKACLNFIMLNPSTADEIKNDPTVERCERRARAAGYGGLLITNIFSLRSTDPAALYTDAEPTDDINDTSIMNTAKRAGKIICAWGTHGALRDRGNQVAAMLTAAGFDLYALKITGAGQPGHPLYIGYDTADFLWRAKGDE